MEPFLGQIQPFGFNFAPRGWASCEGQLLQISINTALFSLLGTQFGGNGQTTFGLPDLRGRTMLGQGSGPGLSPVIVGEQAGAESVTLLTSNLPAHTHPATATTTICAENAVGDKANPAGQLLAGLPNLYKVPDANPHNNLALSPEAAKTTVTVGAAGGSQPTDIRNPYLGLMICIALEGIYPPRN